MPPTHALLFLAAAARAFVGPQDAKYYDSDKASRGARQPTRGARRAEAEGMRLVQFRNSAVRRSAEAAAADTESLDARRGQRSLSTES